MKYVPFLLLPLITTNAFAEDCNVQVVETYYDSSSQVSSKKTKDYSFNEIKRNSASILIYSEANGNYECKSFVDAGNVIVNCIKDNSTPVGKAIVAAGNSGSVNIDNVFSLDITNCKKEVKETSPVVATVATVATVPTVKAPTLYVLQVKEDLLNNSGLFVQLSAGASSVSVSMADNKYTSAGFVTSLFIGPTISLKTNHSFMVIGVEETVAYTPEFNTSDDIFPRSAKNRTSDLSLTNFALHFQFRSFFLRPSFGLSHLNLTSGEGSLAYNEAGQSFNMSKNAESTISFLGSNVSFVIGGMGKVGNHWWLGGQFRYSHSTFDLIKQISADSISGEFVVSSF